MRKIGTSPAEVDASKIVEDSDEFLVVPAIIAREGVFPYPEGKAYKPASELKDAAFTAEGAWVVAEKHPDTVVLTVRNDIKGKVEGAKFSDEINGILGNLRFFKAKCDAVFLAEIKTGKRKDVSLGFFYDYDATPGKWNEEPYDFVQRNILVDHVAAGVPVGRCRSPYCGIAVDALIRKVALDPEETDHFIHIPVSDSADFVQGSFRTITIDATKGIMAVVGKRKTDPEGSMHIQSFLFDKSKDWTMEKAQAWIQEHEKSADAEWDTKCVDDLPDASFAYIEPDGEKDDQGKTVPRSLRHLPFKNAKGEIDHDHLVNALACVSQSATMPEGGKGEARSKLCGAVRSWNKEHPDQKIESEVCGAQSSADALCEIGRARRLLESMSLSERKG
jgi:hypothetical protein